MIAAILAALLLQATPLPATAFGPPDSTPTTLTVLKRRMQGSVAIAEVRFTSDGRTIRALSVTPTHVARNAPAVLFAHWLGDPATTNRTEFLTDAVWLAQRGVVSLLPDESWSQLHWFDAVRSTATDAADSRNVVRDLRRSLDVLVGSSAVDPERIAFVGHDFGAMYGALFSALEPRVRYAVFMTPTLTFREWFLLDTKRPPADRAAYDADLAVFDLPPYLQRMHLAGSLAQFASRDEYVSAASAVAFGSALPPGDRTIRTYDTGHALAIPAATRDRRAWLVARLHL